MSEYRPMIEDDIAECESLCRARETAQQTVERYCADPRFIDDPDERQLYTDALDFIYRFGDMVRTRFPHALSWIRKLQAALNKRCQCQFEDGGQVSECHLHAVQRSGRRENGDPVEWRSKPEQFKGPHEPAPVDLERAEVRRLRESNTNLSERLDDVLESNARMVTEEFPALYAKCERLQHTLTLPNGTKVRAGDVLVDCTNGSTMGMPIRVTAVGEKGWLALVYWLIDGELRAYPGYSHDSEYASEAHYQMPDAYQVYKDEGGNRDWRPWSEVYPDRPVPVADDDSLRGEGMNECDHDWQPANTPEQIAEFEMELAGTAFSIDHSHRWMVCYRCKRLELQPNVDKKEG